MSFVLRMAGREMRGSWRRLVFFFLCVAVGVGAIVALRSVIQNVRTTLASEARTLLAADVLVQSNQPWTPETLAILDDEMAGRPSVARTMSIETATMVRPGDETKPGAKMVELRGVEPGFPFYGRLTLAGGEDYSWSMLEDHGALVRPELLAQLGLSVGDEILIGDTTFEVRGVIELEPGRRLSAFSFGPRVLIAREALEAAGLLTRGSRARYQALLRVPAEEIEPLTASLRDAYRDEFVSVRSYRRTEDRIGDNLSRAEDYLSLVGFVILILGGIGVWSVTRVFVRQKIRSIAVLKCLGASNAQVLATAVVQVLVLGGVGSAVGILIAAAAIAAIPEGVAVVPVDVDYGLTWSAAAQGFGVGLLVSLLFALPPLLDIRYIKPLLLLRQEASELRRPSRRSGTGRIGRWLDRWDPAKAAVSGVVLAGLIGLAVWQAGSLEVGLYVSLGFAGVATFLHLTGAALIRAVTPLGAAPWFPLRHAVISLRRPGNQTRVILLAVGIGSFFIIGVRGLQHNLQREFALELRDDAPDMFLIDVQGDQVDGVRAMLPDDPGGFVPRLIPVIRARVTGVQGREVNLDGFEDVRGRGSLGREYVITYREHLEDNETVVAGVFWGETGGSAPQVSIEDSIRDRFDIQIGDQMRFDVLGQPVEATVTSVREVEWEDSRSGGFMFVFNPAALAGAPVSYIATLKAPPEPAARAALQRDLVGRFPNVSAIDVREVVRTLERVVGNATLAISIVGGISWLSGALILIGAVAMTKFQRIYEAAILKTLGATTRVIATMLALEYGTLGALAGAIGAVGGLALSWALSTQVLEIDWSPALSQNALGILVTAALVGGVGVAASLDVLRRKPLASLRAE